MEMRGDDVAEPFARIPELAASRITEKISSGEYSINLSRQQYLKHVEGTQQYNQYRKDREAKGLLPQSVLIIPESEAQQLIRDKAGTGIVGVSNNGEILSMESITADRVIGRTWSGREYIDTRKARIHYGKKSAHIVPIGGLDYD